MVRVEYSMIPWFWIKILLRRNVSSVKRGHHFCLHAVVSFHALISGMIVMECLVCPGVHVNLRQFKKACLFVLRESGQCG